MTELKLCPFCGKAVTIADYGSYLCIIAKGTDPKTSCRCRLFMESEQFSADDEEARQRAKLNLVEKWNRRSDGWHTETPSVIEDDENWQWNYALILHTEYDCIGNYIAGLLFRPNFEKGFFENDDIRIPFSEVVAWMRIEPYKEDSNG